jgi:hypothetical protein
LASERVYPPLVGVDVSSITFSALGRSVFIVGGVPPGETYVMWWSFVGRTGEEIVAVRNVWVAGEFGQVDRYAGIRCHVGAAAGRPQRAVAALDIRTVTLSKYPRSAAIAGATLVTSIFGISPAFPPDLPCARRVTAGRPSEPTEHREFQGLVSRGRR